MLSFKAPPTAERDRWRSAGSPGVSAGALFESSCGLTFVFDGNPGPHGRFVPGALSERVTARV